MTWLWWAAGLILLFGAAMSSRIRIRFHFIREKDNDHLSIHIRALYGLMQYKLEIPYFNFDGIWQGFTIKSEQSNTNQNKLLQKERSHWSMDTVIERFEQATVLIRHVFDFAEWLNVTLSHIKCTELRWTTRIGLGDAADTAVGVGVIWGLKTSLLGFAFRRIRLAAKPRLAVDPQYNRHMISTSLLCIAEIRLGYAMVAGLLFIVRILRVKGGLKTWQNILFRA